MVTVEARAKIGGKHFEISVDFDEAMKVKNGTGDITRAMNSADIYTDVKKGNAAAKADLMAAFGTSDVYAVATHIITKGELQKPQEFRDAEREARVRRVVDLIVRNAVDQHGKPYTPERIERAIHEARCVIDARAPEQQMQDIVEKLKVIIPIRIEMKRIKLTIPARFSGQVYGLLKDGKENEEWLANGDLQVVVAIPAGIQLDFYDKLNSVTHGAVISEELK